MELLSLLRRREYEMRQARLKHSRIQFLEAGKAGSAAPVHAVYLLGHVSVCGGVKITLEHANRLTEQGVRVTLISHFPRPDWFSIKADFRSIPFGIELARGIPADCSVIVATYWDQISACVESGIAPVIYFEQGDFHLFSSEELTQEVKEAVKKQYLLPGFVTTVSETAAQKIGQLYGRQARVFNNAVDERIFFPKEDRPAERYVLAVGSDYAGFKRIRDIWEACRLLRSLGLEINFKWVAQSPPEKPVGTVVVNPPQHMLGDIYRSAWLFVSASEYESFSLPVLEAMSCGTPVITTPNDGVRSYCTDGENCLFFKPRDICGLAEAIARLWGNPDLYDKLQQNGYKTAGRFKWSKTIPELKAFYEEVSKYRPGCLNKEDEWQMTGPVELPDEEWQAARRFLCCTAADLIYLPYSFSLAGGHSVVRWYPSFRRKRVHSGQPDYLYLGFRELPLEKHPYADAITEFLIGNHRGAISKFKALLDRSGDFMENAVLLRWIAWSLVEAELYDEALGLILRGLKYYPFYTDLYYLQSLIFTFLNDGAASRPAYDFVRLLGDAAGFREYMKTLNNWRYSP